MSIIRYGKTNSGKQRFFDKKTGKTFVMNPERVHHKIKQISSFMYLNGMSFRGISSTIGYSHTSIINWFKQQSNALSKSINLPCQESNNQNLYKDIEIDEFFTYHQNKKQKLYVWLAVCRHSMQIIAYHISTKRNKKSFNRLFRKLAHLNILNIHTDKYKAYNDIHKTHNHTTTKAETYSVESTNNRFRHKIARFKRRSISFSKTKQMAIYSVSALSIFINSDIKKFADYMKIIH